MNERLTVHFQGRNLKGIVFDLDGTLVDSIDVYYRALEAAAEQTGIPLRRQDVFEPLAEGLDMWSRAVPSDLPDREEKILACKRLLVRAFPEILKMVRPLPGVKEALDTLAGNGLRMGVVTDAGMDALKPLRTDSIAAHFTAMITSDHGVPRKPAAEGILECLRRMNVDPGDAATVGDTLMDIWAGKKAGTLTIGVLSGLASRHQFVAHSPTALVEDVSRVPLLLGLG